MKQSTTDRMIWVFYLICGGYLLMYMMQDRLGRNKQKYNRKKEMFSLK